MLLKTRTYAWDGGSVRPLFAELAAKYILNKKQTSGLFNGYVEETSIVPDYAGTLFGIINGITRAGQRMANKEWFAMDRMAGDLVKLDSQGWDYLTTRAKGLKDKEVDAAFAMAA